jgi:hypothetical protein
MMGRGNQDKTPPFRMVPPPNLLVKWAERFDSSWHLIRV